MVATAVDGCAAAAAVVAVAAVGAEVDEPVPVKELAWPGVWAVVAGLVEIAEVPSPDLASALQQQAEKVILLQAEHRTFAEGQTCSAGIAAVEFAGKMAEASEWRIPDCFVDEAAALEKEEAIERRLSQAEPDVVEVMEHSPEELVRKTGEQSRSAAVAAPETGGHAEA